MIQDIFKSIIWDLVYVVLGYCLVYKVTPVLSLKGKWSTIIKIIGLLIIVFSVFSIIKLILR